MRVFIIILFFFGFFSGPEAFEQEKTADWIRSQSSFEKFESFTFNADPKKHQTDAIVIIKDGKLIYERYDHGYDSDKRHLCWSMTKSISSALVGVAVKEGILSMDRPVIEYLKEDQSVPKELLKKHPDLTLRHLLYFTSGIDFQETYEEDPVFSNVVDMLYNRNRFDMGLASLKLGYRFKPGQHYYYSSGDSNVIMRVLKSRMDKKVYDNYPYEKLFDKLGMKSVVFEQDLHGTFVASSYIYSTARDLARFGILYLNDGVHKGERLLPEGWVKFSRTPGPAVSGKGIITEKKKKGPAAHFWTNYPLPLNDMTKPYKDIPESVYWASGHHGQRLFIIPHWNAVIVRFGLDNKGKKFDWNKFYLLTEKAFKLK